MDKLIIAIAGGFIGALGALLAQYIVYLKERKFRRMEKLEELISELYKLQHFAHSLKIGNIEGFPNSYESKRFLMLSAIYFKEYHSKILKVEQHWNDCFKAALNKNEQNFMSSLNALDSEVKSYISASQA